jgi:hypothetical protein
MARYYWTRDDVLARLAGNGGEEIWQADAKRWVRFDFDLFYEGCFEISESQTEAYMEHGIEPTRHDPDPDVAADVDPQLRRLLEPYVTRPAPREGATEEQLVTFSAKSLADMARTFLDYEGEIDLEALKAWVREAPPR